MKHRKAPEEGRPATPHRAHSRGDNEFRALMDAAVDAIVVIGHEGTIEEFSLAAQRVFGYTADEVRGRNVGVLMPEPFRSQHGSHLDRFMTTGEKRVIGVGREVTAQRKDGSVFPCEIAVGQVSGVDPPRFVGFIRDITKDPEGVVLPAGGSSSATSTRPDGRQQREVVPWAWQG